MYLAVGETEAAARLFQPFWKYRDAPVAMTRTAPKTGITPAASPAPPSERATVIFFDFEVRLFDLKSVGDPCRFRESPGGHDRGGHGKGRLVAGTEALGHDFGLGQTW